MAPLPECRATSLAMAESMRLLTFTLGLYRRIVQMHRAKVSNNPSAIQSALDAAMGYAVSHSAEYEREFDLFGFAQYIAKYSKT